MKKLFATALMAMSMGSAFAQGNIVANDTVKTDTTKNCPAQGCQKSLAALISNDTVTTDSTKAALEALNDTVTTDSAKAQPSALVAANDTVVTDSTKAQPAKPTALVAMIEEKDTTQTKDAKTTPSTCDKKAGEKAIQALNAMRKITA